MHLQLLQLLQNSSFVKKLLREVKKKILTYFFSRTPQKAHSCRYTLVVCGLQINVSYRLSSLVPARHTEDCNNSPV